MNSVTITQGRLWAAPVCPKCTTHLDGFTGLNGSVPEPGSVSICASCHVRLTFVASVIGGGLSLREQRPEDIERLPAEERRMYEAMCLRIESMPRKAVIQKGQA